MTLTSLLTGCANCSLLSSDHSALCNVEYAVGIVLLAPVMLPAMWIDDTVKDLGAKQRYKDMVAGVLKQEPVASEECMLRCARYDQDANGTVYSVKAAQTVLAREAGRASTDPRSALLIMTAHQTLAYAVWHNNPDAFLQELNRAYESVPPTFDFTNITLPSDESHVWDKNVFSRQARELIENLLIQDQRVRYEAGQRKWVCDTSKFKALLTISEMPAQVICPSAEGEWTSRLEQASQAAKKQGAPLSAQAAPSATDSGATP